jgi:hypothetical protein
MFGGPEGQSLDGVLPQEVEETLGREVKVGDRVREERDDA